MGMEPYDPRQWSNGGQILGSQMALQQRTNAGTRHTSGAEGQFTLLADEMRFNANESFSQMPCRHPLRHTAPTRRLVMVQ